MKRTKRKYYNEYFRYSHQIFGVIKYYKTPDNIPPLESDMVLIKGRDKTPFNNILTVSTVQGIFNVKGIIKRKEEPLIQKYIDACNNKDEKQIQEIVKKLIMKYQ